MRRKTSKPVCGALAFASCARSPSSFVLLACSIALGAVLPPSLSAQTKYPGIEWVHPVVIARGVASEVEVRANGDLRTSHSALIEGAELVEGEGIDAEVQPPADLSKATSNLRLTLHAGANAAVGPRDLRLATAEAITTLARIYVTDLPVHLEAEAHASRETSQTIELPCAVSGRTEKNVELDWYRFEARAEERVSFEVIGTRLHETIHKIGRFLPHYDAYLSIFDDNGREIASADDHYFADPFLSFLVPEDGVYHVVVREANYKASPQFTYALIARRGPVATLTYPLAVAPGTTSRVSLLGPGLEDGAAADVSLPADAPTGREALVRPLIGDSATRELLVLASDLPLTFEAEGLETTGNDSVGDAEIITLPAGIAGRLARPDDADTFAFDARKGTRYRFEVFARRLFSPLDSELEILDANGKVLANGDDARDIVGRAIRDSAIEWTAPADARYRVRLRDLYARGGADFVYHLEAEALQPDFELTFDPELAMLAPGNRTAIFVRADRRGGFDGEIQLEVNGLPHGVEAFVPPIRPGMTDACVVFSVEDGTAPCASSFSIRGSAEISAENEPGAAAVVMRLSRRASPLVEIYQAQRVLGRTAGIAVTARSDIAVETDVEELVLRPGETKPIPVRLIRDEAYRSGSVSLWADWRFGGRVFGSSLPPGVTLDERASRLGIVGEGLEGLVALRADPKASPIERVPTVVIGLIPIEFSVFVPFTTKPIYLTVQASDGEPLAAGAGATRPGG